MSDSVQPHRRQPTRLPRPWDSPGKNTGLGCHFLLQCMKMKSESEVAQSCPTLATPWTAAYQALPPMGFSRQEYWSGVPLPSPNSVLLGFKMFLTVALVYSFLLWYSVHSFVNTMHSTIYGHLDHLIFGDTMKNGAVNICLLALGAYMHFSYLRMKLFITES